MSEWSGLIRVELPNRVVFGLVVKHGVVYDCAPYARRDSLGKPADVVCRHWKSHGAKLQVIV